jgi:dihydroorotate dehydrogenase (NAD+) catalytic subunit
MRPTLNTDFGGVMLPTPVLAAAGCLRSPKELHGLVDLHKLGGIVTTSVTLAARAGAPVPRVTETPSGVLSAVGWQNPGVKAFVEHELPALLKTGVPIIVSIAGSSLSEYVQVATALSHAGGIAGLELNLACPDEERDGGIFAHRADRAAEVAGSVSRLTRLPVFAKLSADVYEIADIAGACAHAGVSGVTLISGPLGMAIGVMSMNPQLGATIGRLSGPAIRPIAVRAVYEVARALPNLPIFGVGGIVEPQHALEMMLAGASAVQVGTAMLVNPSAPVDIAKGLLAYLKAMGLSSPAEIGAQPRLPKAGA